MLRLLLAVPFALAVSSCLTLSQETEYRLARLEILVARAEQQALLNSETGRAMLAGEGHAFTIETDPLGVPRSTALTRRRVEAAWLVPDQPGYKGIVEALLRNDLASARAATWSELQGLFRTGVPDEPRERWSFEAVPPGDYDLFVFWYETDAGGRSNRYTYAAVDVSESGDVSTTRHNVFPDDKRRLDRLWFLGDPGALEVVPSAFRGPQRVE